MAHIVYLPQLVALLVFAWTTPLIHLPSKANQVPSGKPLFTEIPFRIERDKILLTVQIGGQDRTFLLDTGAPFMLDRALVDEMGYTATGTKGLKDATGNKTRVNTWKVPEFTMGDARFRKVEALSYDFRNSILGCFGIDGIIGSNVLHKTVLQFDWRRGTLVLTDSARRLGLDPGKAMAIRIDDRQSSPYMPMILDGQVTVWALLDTGSDDFFTISQEHLASIQAQGRLQDAVWSSSAGSASLGLMGGKQDSRELLIRVQNLSIQSISVSGPVGIESNQDDDSRVGMTLLQRGKLTLDYPNKRLWFEPYPDIPDYRYSSFGIGFAPEGEDWIIREVWSGSGASEAGILVGDTLLQFGSLDVRTHSVCDMLFKLPEQREQDSVTVVVRHAGTASEQSYSLRKSTYPEN